MRKPIQCEGCGEGQLLRNFTHRKENTRNIHKIEDVTPSMMWQGPFLRFMLYWKVSKYITNQL